MKRDAASAFAAGPPLPRADVGVLLVHGIGDHKEGDTLTSFGEPLVDWMREWLRARGGNKTRGEAAVPAARLRATRTEAESPAFAELQLRAPARTGGVEATEKWLLCEAWWGGSVQAPPSMTLLRWMWTRGPLLIYWHIYLGFKPGKDDAADPLLVPFSLFAFVLAGMCQLLISLAILLWIIPVGPWRRGVVAVVRALTLTLGDSYVLLEQDIQRGALVQRVRKSLAWLEDRVDRIVVLAHSQGGAIAHEALRGRPAGKVRLFLSVGSGLEKLQFLRAVREWRRGLLSASLIFPVAALGVGGLIHGWVTDQRVLMAIGGALLVTTIGLAAGLSVALSAYRELLVERLPDAALAGLPRRRWLDLHASHDVVPMGKRSVFADAPFLQRTEILNERSFINDHTEYFGNRGAFLWPVWQAMSRLSSLRLFELGERGLLGRHAVVHGHYARVLAASHVAILVATVVLAVVTRNELVAVGESLLKNLQGPLADALKPVRALAGVVAGVIERVWPSGASEKTVTDAFFGGAVLFGAIVLWWISFKGFWRARCLARWRRACRREDILDDRNSRITHGIGCATFGIVGFTPLLIAVLLAFVPQAFVVGAISDISAATLAWLAIVMGTGYVAAGPWIAREMWRDADSIWLMRLSGPLWAAAFAGLFFWFGFWLWPPLQQQQWIVAGAYAIAALAWHVFAVMRLRHHLGTGWLAFTLIAPLAGALALSRPGFAATSGDVAAAWFVFTLAAIGFGLAASRRRGLIRLARRSFVRLRRQLPWR